MTAAAINPLDFFLSYQRRWIEDESPIAFFEKSRRVGADFAEAFRVVYRRFFGITDVDHWYSSADEDAALEWMLYVKDFAQRLFGAVIEMKTGVQVFDREDVKVYTIRLPKIGKRRPRITAMASSPRRFRGKGGDVTISEYAFHNQPVEMWKAVAPVTTWGGQIRVISTHNGDDSEFEAKLGQLRKHLDPETYGKPKPTDIQGTIHRVDIYQAVADGLAKRVAEVNGDKITANTDRDFIKGLKAKCGSLDVWREEYECIPSQASSQYFPFSLLRRVVRDSVPCITDDTHQFLADIARTYEPDGGRLFVGCDVGRRKDHFALCVIQSAMGVSRIRGLLGFTGRPFSAMEYAIHAVMKSSPWSSKVCRLAIDETGLGMQMAERMVEQYHHRVEAVTFTTAVLTDLVTTARLAIEEMTTDLPDDHEFLMQYGTFQRKVTSAGNVRFNADAKASGHSDEAIAHMLALHAADKPESGMRFLPEPAGGVFA